LPSRAYDRPVLVEESIEIGRPPEHVWAFVADPTNDPRWCPKVKSVVAVGEARWKVVHKPVPLRPSVSLQVEHVVREPPTRLVLREEDDVSIFEVEYRLAAAPPGTRFAQVSTFQWKRLPRFLQNTFARGVRRDIRAQLRQLKRLLEAG